ncbi:MAG: phage holin family protein [Cyanobacteriota bacterium]
MNLKGAAKVTALLTSVMDLHVRIAMQEADKEKRRLIGGGVFLGMGLGLASMACLALQLAMILWIRERFGLTWLQTALAVTLLNSALATVCLRVGGGLLKGPILPETTAGLIRTTRALRGRF